MTPNSVHNEITGGVFFAPVIQGQVVNLQLPPTIAPALSGLPPATGSFTGRDREIGAILQALAPEDAGTDHQPPVLVSALSGLAGIGKTELAVQAAVRAVRERGWFPGGVLFIDLFGYDPDRRLTPERALDGLLRALGIPAEHIPPGLQDRARLYRSALDALAAAGRRVLLVLDNAATAAQVEPLLPADGRTAALVTSRHTLDIGARLHDLDTLAPDAAVDLLARAIHEARGADDTRMAADPEAAATIAALCAGLPLALRIAAALLADHPTRPVASLAQALATAHTRLDRLRREDRAVRAAFDLSYHQLAPAHARLFRLLPLNPGPDVGTEAAAELLGEDPYESDSLLQDLARAHLIEPGQAWGRWRLHDLVRLYADRLGGEHAEEDEREDAQERLCQYYLLGTDAAGAYLVELESEGAPRFPDRSSALAWLDGEYANVVALALAIAASPQGGVGRVVDLAAGLMPFCNLRRRYDDGIRMFTAALEVCQSSDDLQREREVLSGLAIVLSAAYRFDEALAMHTRALAICHRLGDDRRATAELSRLSSVLIGLNRYEEAADAGKAAVTTFQELGDVLGEATALVSLGMALYQAQRLEEAVAANASAVDCYRALGMRVLEAVASTNAGLALQGLGRFHEAHQVLSQAIAVFREFGDRGQEGDALTKLGMTLAELRRFEEAVDAFSESLAISKEFGDRHLEVNDLANLGLALGSAERFAEAVDTLGQATALARDLDDAHAEADVCDKLGSVLRGGGHFEEAAEAHRQAVLLFEELDAPYPATPARCHLGLALLALNRVAEAVDALQGAVVGYRSLTAPHDEGCAFHSLGLALLLADRPAEAIEAQTRAIALFQSTNDHLQEARAWHALGHVQCYLSKFTEAQGSHARALALFTELADHEAAAGARLGAAIAHNEHWRQSDIPQLRYSSSVNRQA
ncbi:tetratricopeptide (TPR) repeat protein [Kitasatospora sp. GP30]|uniref:tetratricopeptide repeat protein n=1 Tax=Kitasatospora sp. GP30 TaxID=3035084 RepID=UPI000C70576C|nr:tetratricopeptide repeat protein [Kitasatospora sp. GP30]MDH6138809.1 tetratricopeptide (TPR) repeat protein [Kitasatospora sp. GP30]